jgi:hypothetical protein
MSTLTDSRLGPGTLSLGSKDFGVQISNVKLVPNHNTEDGTPTLGIPKPASMATTTWSLTGTAIQDWEDAAGFVKYCFDNNNKEVAFDWVPNNGKAVKWSGKCVVLAIEFGGDVNKQNTSDWEFSLVGDPTEGAHTPVVQTPVTK